MFVSWRSVAGRLSSLGRLPFLRLPFPPHTPKGHARKGACVKNVKERHVGGREFLIRTIWVVSRVVCSLHTLDNFSAKKACTTKKLN